jgi:hypothetical protein
MDFPRSRLNVNLVVAGGWNSNDADRLFFSRRNPTADLLHGRQEIANTPVVGDLAVLDEWERPQEAVPHACRGRFCTSSRGRHWQVASGSPHESQEIRHEYRCRVFARLLVFGGNLNYGGDQR